ncbi:MAG: prephenate dehydrogenase/arogenate dehydrogenase family protein [Methanomicrobiales archaeon]|nr:prephenate dehydrogenase/arogenate dehydrogenase family protein [Methanomicrobiales archaeon]
MKIGIIGGTGGMGNLFSEVFKKSGHDVFVSGRKTEITNEDIARLTDIVIISVPISETVPVILKIAPLLKEHQILSDFTSLKVEPIHAMLTSRARVIGFHPMFGPTVGSIHGQTIIATPVRCKEDDILFFTSLFEGQGARVTLTSPDDHDKMMAVIQGLTHFKAILLAGTMRRLGISPADTEVYMSPVYRIETGIAGRLLSQNPELYADILCMNPYFPEVLLTCQNAGREMADIIFKGDRDAFQKEFLASKEWFGSFCDQAQEETDHLIQAMVEK